MNRLLYLSYGTGLHEHEVAFSVNSAFRWNLPGTSYRSVVYTDHPESFENLPIDTHFVSPETWTEWGGIRNFKHRRKILALQDAIARYDSPVVLLDGDTWLKAPVDRLFERVGPGKSLMHIREGQVSEVATPLYSELHVLLNKSILENAAKAPYQISSESIMWNAGVIGIHPADACLLDDVLSVTDQLLQNSDLHVLEQFAFSFVLSQHTLLREGHDLVFHYWPPYLHQPFRERVAELMAISADMPLEQRIHYLYSHRPRPTWIRRGKVIAKRILQMAGLIRGRCRSNEW